jgi:hypothetical protein
MAVTQAMLALLLKAPSEDTVNVSSGLGSLTKSANPSWTRRCHAAQEVYAEARSIASRLLPEGRPSRGPDDAGIEENVEMAEIGIDNLRHTSNRGGIPELDLQLDGRPRRLRF